MVHKKYTYKNGKRFGPYLYETERVDGKIITRYLGHAKSRNNLKKYLFPAAFFFVLGVLLLFFFISANLTGNATLDIKTRYVLGEQIEGNLILNLKAGELIPVDSVVLIGLNSIEREIALKDLITEQAVNGDFYAEGLDLSGSGEGYGISGIREIYPSVSFELEIVKEFGSGSSGSGSSKIDEPQMQDDLNADKKETPAESKENSEENKQETSDSNSESSGGGSESGGGSPAPGITGAAISEFSSGITGTAVNGQDFVHELSEGQSARLISGSVTANGEAIGDENVKVDINRNEVIVSTDYYLEEKGFGKEYLGNNKLTLIIDLEDFNFRADEGVLSAKLSYEGQTIVEVFQGISVSGNLNKSDEKNEEIVPEIGINKTSNESIISPNKTIEPNLSINVELVHDEIKLNEPVKWVKKVDNVDGPASFSIFIPEIAENISIDKIEKEFDNEGTDEVADVEENVEVSEPANNEPESINADITGSIITGAVTADLSLNRENRILKWFRNILRLTGFAVSEEAEAKEGKEILIELSEFEKGAKVSYYTPAPYAIEENLTDGRIGKKVLIIGPDEIHYENVLSFTNLDESYNLIDKDDLKIYWEEKQAYVVPVNVSDLDEDGIYDYAEWIIPELSNQTFDLIIEIVSAEHLDSNRTFISDIYPEVSKLDGNWSETIPAEHYVRVKFERNLTSDRDISIYPRAVNGSPRIEVYEINENKTIAEFESINDNEYNKVFLTGLEGEQDSFDLRILGGSVEFDHIIDPSTNYLINADASTTATGTTTGGFNAGKNIVRLNSDLLIALWQDASSDASCSDSSDEGVNWNTYDSLTGTHSDMAIATNGSAIIYMFTDDTGGQNDISYIYNVTADCNVANSGAIIDVSGGTNDNYRPDVAFDGTTTSGRFLACSMDNDDFDMDFSFTNLGATLAWTTRASAGGPGIAESCSLDMSSNGNVYIALDDAATSSLLVINSSGSFTANQTTIAYGLAVSNMHLSIRGTTILITAIDAASEDLVVINSSDGIVYSNATYAGTFNDSEGCLDANNNAHIVFENNTAIDYIKYTSTGFFTAQEQISDNTGALRFPSVRCSNYPSNNQLGSSELELVYTDQATDVYFANITIDTSAADKTSPQVMLINPSNNTITTTGIAAFGALFTDDVNVSNATLFVYNSTNDLVAQNFTGLGNSSIVGNITHNIGLNGSGAYYWNFLAMDNAIPHNQAFNTSNFTLTYSPADAAPPNITVYFPKGANYTFSDLPFTFNVSLDENGSVSYSMNNGVDNISMNGNEGKFGTAFTHSNNSLLTGTYVFRVYANDTLGNNNFTVNVTFGLNVSLVSACTTLHETGKTYFLNNTLSTTASCLVVNASNIALEGEGFTIEHTGPVIGTVHGIELRDPAENLTVKNTFIPDFTNSIGVTYTGNNGNGGKNITIRDSEVEGLLNNGEICDATCIASAGSGGPGGAFYLYNTNVTKQISAAMGAGDGSATSEGGLAYIEDTRLINLTNIAVNLSAFPTFKHGRLIINYSGQFADLNSSYGNNITITLINGTTSGGEIKFISGTSALNLTNLSLNTELRNNFVFANSTIFSHLNKTANITFYNMPGNFRYPKVYRDNAICNDCYNFTSLNAGTVIFNISGFSNYSIQDSNNAPAAPTPEINSTLGTNRTNENLNCFDTLIDPEGDRINVTVMWINNSLSHLVVDFNNSYANNSFFNATLLSGNTTKNHNWTCSMRLYDGLEYSNWVNSSNLTIINTPPGTPTLSSPADGSSTTDRTPTFVWTAGSDDDGDSLFYELNLTCRNILGGGCSGYGEDNRHISFPLGLTSHKLSGDLLYLYDNNYQYNWSIRAYDEQDYSAWTDFFRVNISSLIQMSLPNSSINFGQISQFGTNDTSDNSPLPFLIQNDGNSFVNVTIGATDLWRSQANPSTNYQFKIDNYTLENGSFNWVLSKFTYTNITLTASPILAIARLNYTNATDTAEIDINVTVPLQEAAGARNSTVTFTGSLGE